MIYILNFKTYFKKERDYLSLIKKLKKIKRKNKIWLSLNPYFYLLLRKKIRGFQVGIQNLGFESEKPQTGEIIYEFELINKAHFVLLGHSERYRLGENLEIIERKINTLQDKKINLVIFFSENSYKPQESFKKIKNKTEKNLNFLLHGVKKENYKKIYLCYEPWWTISSEGGRLPSKEFLNDFLKWYKQNYSFSIFYGGSYNSQIKEIYKNLNFGGFVLGKASTDFEELKNLLS